MEYRKLGHTDLDVSLLCLGTMTFGQQNNEGEAYRQLDYAVEHGINFIDCAEMYPVPPKSKTQGRTEQYIGNWLVKRGRRDDLIIATKATGPGPAHIRGGPRLNREHIEQAIEGSLQRLQTHYIDLYQIHWPERKTNFFGKLGYIPHDDTDTTAIEETLAVLADLVNAGKVRYIGISNETPWGMKEYLRLAERHKLPRIVSIQNPYNLLNRSYEVGLAEMSYRENIGLLAYSPLAFGVLSGKYLHGQKPEHSRITLWGEHFIRYTKPHCLEATRRYVELARQHDLSPAQMALAFVNSRPFLSSTIIGATRMDQLQEDIESINLKLSKEVLAGIEAVHLEISNPAP